MKLFLTEKSTNSISKKFHHIDWILVKSRNEAMNNLYNFCFYVILQSLVLVPSIFKRKELFVSPARMTI